MATPYFSPLKEVQLNEYHHLLKLWSLYLKNYLRGNPEAVYNVRRLANKALDKETFNNDTYYLMSEIIKVIKSNVDSEIQDFVCKCEESILAYSTPM